MCQSPDKERRGQDGQSAEWPEGERGWGMTLILSYQGKKGLFPDLVEDPQGNQPHGNTEDEKPDDRVTDHAVWGKMHQVFQIRGYAADDKGREGEPTSSERHHCRWMCEGQGHLFFYSCFHSKFNDHREMI